MNPIHHEKFESESKRLFLDPARKAEIRANLVSFMEKAPVRDEVPNRYMNMGQALSGRLERIMSLKKNVLRIMPIALILALILGGGATFAAESALPGDTLYPVKVEVNENVRGWFAASDEAKAKWESELAERRLEEAEKLAADGRLDASATADLKSRFSEHSAEVKSRVEVMESADDSRPAALSVSSDFDAKLRAHTDILTALSVKKTEVADDVRDIVAVVNAEANAVASVKADAESGIARGNAEAEVKIRAAAEARRKAAEQKIAEARKLLSAPQVADVATYAEAEAKIKLADELYGQGEGYFKAEAYGKAFVSFQEAFANAVKAWTVLRGSAALQVSVGSATAVSPGIAPNPNPNQGQKTPQTVAEAKYREAVSTIAEIRTFISVRLGVMTEEMAKRVEAQLALADRLVAEGKSYFSAGAYEKASVSFDGATEAAKAVHKILYGDDPRVPAAGNLVPVQKTSPSGEVEIEFEDSLESGKNRSSGSGSGSVEVKLR
jgi:tetratricopeptide (TPR) repeat protein